MKKIKKFNEFINEGVFWKNSKLSNSFETLLKPELDSLGKKNNIILYVDGMSVMVDTPEKDKIELYKINGDKDSVSSIVSKIKNTLLKKKILKKINETKISFKDDVKDEYIYSGPIYRTGKDTFATKNKGEFIFIYGAEDTDNPIVKKISNKSYDKNVDKEDLIYNVTLYKTKIKDRYWFEL